MMGSGGIFILDTLKDALNFKVGRAVLSQENTIYFTDSTPTISSNSQRSDILI